MTIEPNTEWFNRTTLTVVTVIEVTPSGAAMIVVPHTTRHWQRVENADFLRDYAPNVPVTPELLHGMGWERAPQSDKYHSRYDLKADDEHKLCVFFADGDFHGFSLFSDKGSELILEEPATLRDLINTLRVLGVAAEIPQEVGT